jgi:hypothetical protein
MLTGVDTFSVLLGFTHVLYYISKIVLSTSHYFYFCFLRDCLVIYWVLFLPYIAVINICCCFSLFLKWLLHVAIIFNISTIYILIYIYYYYYNIIPEGSFPYLVFPSVVASRVPLHLFRRCLLSHAWPAPARDPILLFLLGSVARVTCSRPAPRFLPARAPLPLLSPPLHGSASLFPGKSVAQIMIYN